MGGGEGKEGVAVRWCEAETHGFEYANTASNICYVFAAVLGLRLAKRRAQKPIFIYTEYVLLITFAGSVLFHATQSWKAELFDELPMALNGICYLLTVENVHWVTRAPYKRFVFAAGIGGAVAGMGAYVVLKNYAIFEIAFTLQVLLPATIAATAGPALGVSRRTWLCFLGAILCGKVCWEYERHLYRSGRCPASTAHPHYWLHPLWHFFSAAAHHLAMRYHGSLSVAYYSKAA